MPARKTAAGTESSRFAETMDVTTYLVIGQHYWGQGLSLDEAKAHFKRQGAALGRGYTEIEFPPGVEFHHVDNMFGTVYWNYADPEAEDKVEPVVIEHPARKRK